MNKAFYIAGIVLSVVFMIVTVAYAESVSDARMDYLFSSYDSYNSYSYTSSSTYYSLASDYTFEGALISLFFILFFISSDILGLVKIKTKTTKVLSIIGLSFGAIFLVVDFAMLLSPSSASFDEGGGSFILFALITLAFSIVGLIQSVRFGKRGKSTRNPSPDLLDS